MPTPLQYEAKYRSLAVRAPGNTWITVDIHKYKNNSSTTGDHSTALAKKEGQDPLIAKIREAGKKALGTKKTPHGSTVVLDKLQDDVNPAEFAPGSLYETIDTMPIRRSFVGKGSPEDLAYTLRLILRFKMAEATTASLQKFCDNYLGLDCSGFVTNFIDIELSAKLDPMETSATSYRGPVSKRRAKIEDIQRLDGLAWATTNHVAVIDSVDSTYISALKAAGKTDFKDLPIVVVESNGGKGLTHNTYTVHSVNSEGIFKVHRDYEATGILHKVYIRSLP